MHEWRPWKRGCSKGRPFVAQHRAGRTVKDAFFRISEQWQLCPAASAARNCLNYDSEMDEASDAEDPEQQLRAELADRSALVEAVQGVLECRHIKESDGNGRHSDPMLPSEKG